MQQQHLHAQATNVAQLVLHLEAFVRQNNLLLSLAAIFRSLHVKHQYAVYPGLFGFLAFTRPSLSILPLL